MTGYSKQASEQVRTEKELLTAWYDLLAYDSFKAMKNVYVLVYSTVCESEA